MGCQHGRLPSRISGKCSSNYTQDPSVARELYAQCTKVIFRFRTHISQAFSRFTSKCGFTIGASGRTTFGSNYMCSILRSPGCCMLSLRCSPGSGGKPFNIYVARARNVSSSVGSNFQKSWRMSLSRGLQTPNFKGMLL